jgi:hypothetical protein
LHTDPHHLPPQREPVKVVQGPGGTRREVDNQGKTRGFEGNGKVARFDSHGKPQYVHDDRRQVTISRGPGGERHVMREFPDGRRVVATGARHGYVEHRYTPVGRPGMPNRAYVQRTYVVNNVHYTRVYATYNYHGAPYYRYAPVAYYRPAFYGYAYRPWARPVVYNWGWAPRPWFGFYSGYFAPYPAYPTPSLWLTDFLLAANLQAAYEARADARATAQAQAADQPPPPASAADVQMSPEVKQLIAEEVQRTLAERQALAQQAATGEAAPQPTAAAYTPPAAPAAVPAVAEPEEVPPALKHNPFIVSTSLPVSAEGQECTLTPGDLIFRTSNAPDENNLVTVSILASKPGDCPTGQQVAVSVQDLQEMYNSFLERLDSGLGALAQSSGKGGMPAAPDTSTIAGEIPAPPPDKDADAMLADEQKAADQSEAELQKEVGNSGG